MLYPDDAGDSSGRVKNAANLISDSGGLFCLFSQIGPIVLLISTEQIKLENCACTQIEARGERNRWVYDIRYFSFVRKAGYGNGKKKLHI